LLDRQMRYDKCVSPTFRPAVGKTAQRTALALAGLADDKAASAAAGCELRELVVEAPIDDRVAWYQRQIMVKSLRRDCPETGRRNARLLPVPISRPDPLPFGVIVEKGSNTRRRPEIDRHKRSGLTVEVADQGLVRIDGGG